jgi:hypothetical protein
MTRKPRRGTVADVLRVGAAWLDPDGYWYPCQPWQHDAAAQALAPGVDLQADGWLRLCACGPRLSSAYPRATRRQVLALVGLAQAGTGTVLGQAVLRWLGRQGRRARRLR